MKVFISYARQDNELAKRVRDELVGAGFRVWNDDEVIYPGDNWALKIGQALENSDAMVVLVTPNALASDSLRYDVQFALTSKNYGNRVIPVFAGLPKVLKAGEDVPWILLRLNPVDLESSNADLSEVVQRVRSSAAEASPNAAS